MAGDFSISRRTPRLRGALTLVRGKSRFALPWWAYATGGALVLVGLLKLLSRPKEADGGGDMPAPADPGRPPFPHVEVSPGKYLAQEAGAAFARMVAAARAVGVYLPVNTAWRSREWQEQLYARWVAFKEGRGPKAPMAAKPGKSLHEKGIAVDVAGVDSSNPVAYNAARAAWLAANAERFGFYNTGAFFSSPEPWHWVYGVKREGLPLVS